MFYDFIEIGTSDFDTLIEKADDSFHGLSIEPLDFYLRKLPEKQGCKKINAAVSDKEGTIEIYYVHPEKVDQYHLPVFLKGCNSVGCIHPTIKNYLDKKKLDTIDVVSSSKVPMHRLTTICEDCRVTGIHFLKVDTEGYEPVILNDFFDNCPAELMPYKLLFESNWLSGKDKIAKLISKLLLLGYDIDHSKTIGSNPNTLMRLNLNRLSRQKRFVETPHGYYLTGYPHGYRPADPPHANTLEAAKQFCAENHCGGVTFQYHRYEARQGDYLMDQRGNSGIKSWVYR